MGKYTNERDIKVLSVAMFIERIKAKNKTLGKTLEDNQDKILLHLLSKIQKLGMTDYSDKLLKDRNSKKELKELMRIISDGR